MLRFKSKLFLIQIISNIVDAFKVADEDSKFFLKPYITLEYIILKEMVTEMEKESKSKT